MYNPTNGLDPFYGPRSAISLKIVATGRYDRKSFYWYINDEASIFDLYIIEDADRDLVLTADVFAK